MSAPAVLIHVQHLLGIGHLRRAAALARALGTEGFSVTLASGGMASGALNLGAARLAQLPPMRARDESFTSLLDADGKPIDDTFRAHRRDALLALFAALKPAMLITELFPFGRRQLRFELVPLLEAAAAARPKPLIIASVRDILVAKKDPTRYAEMAALARLYYQRVHVRGDKQLLPFSASFPLADALGALVVHTGYVAEDAAPPANGGTDGQGDVIVSAGGGAVGWPLLDCALKAKPLSPLNDKVWRVLIGHNMPPERAHALMDTAQPGLIIEPARPDFRALLGRASLSISQAGYNTVMDVLASGVRALLVPFASGQETEQTMRAAALANAGRALVLAEADLTPARLAALIGKLAARPAPGLCPYRLDGAERSARLLRAMLGP